MKTGRGKRTALVVGTVAVVVLGVAGWLAWPHLRFWWLFELLGMNAQGLPEYRHRQTGIIFVRVPGGKFWMGASEEEARELLREYGELLKARGYHPPFEEVLGFEKPRHLANCFWEIEMENRG